MKITGTLLSSPWIKAFAIFSLTFLAYIPAINSGFIWDDDGFLTNNPLIKASGGLYRFWFTKEAPDYFPLVSSTLWLEWRMWGEDARGYHIVNVLLHGLSSVLLWKLMEKLKIPGAWFCGLVFAVHPVNVESVAWITERKNTLPMPFYLSALMTYLVFLARGKKRWYVFSLLLYAVSLTAKPMVVMLPFVLLLFIWWIKGRVSTSDVKKTIPFFSLSLFFGLLTVWFQYNNAIGKDVVGYPDLFSKISGAGKALSFYLYKAAIPLNLSFIYKRWDVVNNTLSSYLPTLFIVGAAIVLFKKRASSKPLIFPLAYFTITLAPVLGFLDIYFMRYSFVADHWQYAALPGIIALLTGSAFKLYQFLPEKQRKVLPVSGGLTILFLFSLTWKQGEAYLNSETLWRETIKKNPAAFLAHNDLGNILKLRGNVKEALSHYQQAIKSNPDFFEARNNIGSLLDRMGKPEAALKHFYKAMEIKPDSEIIYNSAGNTLARMGRYKEAETSLNKALLLNREFVPTYINLGYLFSLERRYSESIETYKKALKIDPGNPTLYLNIGVSFAQSGDLKGAVKYYYLALDKNPDYPKAHRNLGIALNRLGKYEKAQYHLSRANR